jgi:hypothetical protein
VFLARLKCLISAINVIHYALIGIR